MTTISRSHRFLVRACPLVRSALLDAGAVLFPVRCVGCGAADRSLCPRCARALEPQICRYTVAGLAVWSALEYGDVPRAVLLAYKDAGRVDATTALARALRAALTAALVDGAAPIMAATHATLPVLIPSTGAARRRRGYHPTGMVLARSRMLVPPLWRALGLSRQTADQAGLSSAERELNRSGSMVGSPRLRGRRCLVVDDIVTSGATIAEAARAIREAGGSVVGAATIAHTPKWRP